MPVDQIAHEQWREFLASYARQHEGWLARFLAPDGSSSRLAALREIRLECVDGHDRIVFGFEGEDHVAPHPRHLRALRADDGTHQGLEVVSDDGDVSALRFRAAALPDTLDGIAPGGRAA